jgi:anti-sigma B factor antagonist
MRAPTGSQAFIARNAQLDDGTPVVYVMGEVDAATAPALERTLENVAGSDKLIVDLTGCSFLDSRGLRVLVAAKGRLERSDRSLALVLSNPSVMRVFELTGSRGSFDFYPSLSALKTQLAR